MKNGLFWVIAVVVLAGLGAWWYFGHQVQTGQSGDNSNASLSKDLSDIGSQIDQVNTDASASGNAQ